MTVEEEKVIEEKPPNPEGVLRGKPTLYDKGFKRTRESRYEVKR